MTQQRLVGNVLLLAGALLGTIACNKLDDIARAGMKAGARGSGEAAQAGAGQIDDAARKVNLDDAKAGIPADEAGRLEEAINTGAELLFDVTVSAFESDAPAPASFVERVQPKYASLVTEPPAWARLSGGEGADSAPWVFDVRPDAQGVLVDGKAIAYRELAAACWRLGTTCVFVGCADEACSKTTRAVFDAVAAPPDMAVDAYTQDLVDTRLGSTPPPVFVMYAGGSATREFTTVLPK